MDSEKTSKHSPHLADPAQQDARIGYPVATILAALGILAAVLALAGSLFVSHRRTEARSQAHRELSAIADLKQRQIVNWREERLSDAAFFARARFVAQDLQAFLDDPQSGASRSNVLNWLTLLKGGHRYDAAIFLDAELTRRLALTTSGEDFVPTELPAMRNAFKTRSIIMGDLYKDADTSVHLDIALPIFRGADTNNGQPLALILLKLNARDFLFPLIQSWPTPSPTAETLLVRKDGEDVLFLNDLRHKAATALMLRAPLNSPELPAARVLRGETAVAQGIDYRGVPTVATGRLIPGTSWAIVAKIDESEVYASLKQQTFGALALLAALMFAGSMLIMFLFKRRTSVLLAHQLNERQAHERAMARMNRLYSTLSQVNSALVRSRSKQDFLNEICSALVSQAGFQLAWIGWREQGASNIVPVSQCAPSASFLKLEECSEDGSENKIGPATFAANRGAAFISNDAAVDPRLEASRAAIMAERWGSLAAFPIREGGQPVAALAVYAGEPNFFGPEEQSLLEEAARDVSFGLDNLVNDERRRAAEEQSRLQVAALQSAANAIVITDRLGIIQWVNSAFERLTGYTAVEAVGKTPRVIKSDKQPADFFKEMWETILAGKVWRGELINRRKDGTCYPEEMTVTPVPDAQGRITHFIAIKQDISERKQAEDALANARDQLAEANSLLEQKVQERTAQLVDANANLQTFVYSAAHDLRSPLTAIRSFSDLVLESAPELTQENRGMLERVSAAAGQISRLLEDMLQYSKISHVDLPLRTVSLTAVAGEVLTLLDVEIRAKEAVVSIDKDMPPVLGHPATLVLLLGNLVSNAIKFTASGVQPHIRISAQKNNSYIRVSVQDNGIGIPPASREKLFTAFQRLHSKRTYPGTGLGLAIVRKGAERMGGSAGIEPDTQGGSTFWIDLPIP